MLCYVHIYSPLMPSLYSIQGMKFPFGRFFKVNVYVQQNILAIISMVFVSNIQNDCIHDLVFFSLVFGMVCGEERKRDRLRV